MFTHRTSPVHDYFTFITSDKDSNFVSCPTSVYFKLYCLSLFSTNLVIDFYLSLNQTKGVADFDLFQV